ncbi:DUF4229 domain-containing protein [Kytococcus sp. Marseille-QA3725]
MLRYTLLRILVFLFFLCGFFLVVELAGWQLDTLAIFWLVVAAALASMIASLFLLKAPRADFNAQIDAAIAKREAARKRKRRVSDEEVEDDAAADLSPRGAGADRRPADAGDDDFV